MAVHVQTYNDRSASKRTESRVWMLATFFFADLTVAVATWTTVEPAPTDRALFLDFVLDRLVFIGLPLLATLGCWKMFVSTKHQDVQYEDKAVSMTTFDAFRSGTADQTTKDYVLMAATNSIYRPISTGLVKASGSDRNAHAVPMGVVGTAQAATKSISE